MSNQRDVFFSVIIPVYNSWECLHRALSSCLVQHYVSYEVIVVDDGSTGFEGAVSLELASERIRFLRLSKNSGPFSARRHGVNAAKGDYIIFLDADDVLCLDFMSVMNRTVLENPADIIFTNVLKNGAGGAPKFNSRHFIRKHQYNHVALSLEEALKLADWPELGTPGKVYKRELLDSVYDQYEETFSETELRYAEDVYLLFMCSLHAQLYAYTPCAIYYYQRTSSSISLALGDNDILSKQSYLMGVISLINHVSATNSFHDGSVIRLFRDQLTVDYHLLSRWRARSRMDGVYIGALWRACKARRQARDVARLIIGGLAYLITGVRR